MFNCSSNGYVEECFDKNGVTSERSSESTSDSYKIRLETWIQSVQTTANWLKSSTSCRPKVAVICGSGLSSLADSVKNAEVFEYSNIPNFVTCTVTGHAGRLVFGSLGGIEVVIMQGRFHAYEDHSMWQLTFPVRVLASLGVEVLIVTNASGSINPAYKVGDLVIIKDHINLPGIGGLHPLKGLSDERFGARFICMSSAYDRKLRLAAWRVGRCLGLGSRMHEGIYLVQCGPSYETPAELRMIRNYGADLVGMSTAPEVIVARQCGLRCFALSLVTNVCVTADDDTSVELADHDDHPEVDVPRTDHSEVLQAGKEQSENIQLFIQSLIAEIGGTK